MGVYKNIQDACGPAGYNIAYLEEELGLGRGSISKWDDHCPSYKKLEAVAQKLGTSVDRLAEGNTWPVTGKARR